MRSAQPHTLSPLTVIRSSDSRRPTAMSVFESVTTLFHCFSGPGGSLLCRAFFFSVCRTHKAAGIQPAIRVENGRPGILMVLDQPTSFPTCRHAPPDTRPNTTCLVFDALRRRLPVFPMLPADRQPHTVVWHPLLVARFRTPESEERKNLQISRLQQKLRSQASGGLSIIMG